MFIIVFFLPHNKIEEGAKYFSHGGSGPARQRSSFPINAQCPVRKTISKMSKIVLTKTELFIFYVQIYVFNFGNVSFLQKCIYFVFCSQLKPKLLLVWQKSNLLAITLLVIFTFFTVVIRALFDTIMSQANSGDSWFNFHNCDTQFLFHFYLN